MTAAADRRAKKRLLVAMVLGLAALLISRFTFGTQYGVYGLVAFLVLVALSLFFALDTLRLGLNVFLGKRSSITSDPPARKDGP
jgi:hypothetical protein